MSGVHLIGLLFDIQVKQESLGISTKMFLKVDVECGKLYFKKSKDGPDEKCFAHNKSKNSRCFATASLFYVYWCLLVWQLHLLFLVTAFHIIEWVRD